MKLTKAQQAFIVACGVPVVDESTFYNGYWNKAEKNFDYAAFGLASGGNANMIHITDDGEMQYRSIMFFGSIKRFNNGYDFSGNRSDAAYGEHCQKTYA